MNIRDEELKRLIKYAEGHNIKVSFKPYVPYSKDVGYATTDGSEIYIHQPKRASKIEIILTLIHELGHSLHTIKDKERVPDPRLDDAIDNEDEKKSHRLIVLNFERISTKYWEEIYRDADLKFPIYKLFLQKEYDIWQYEYWYENGEFPTMKIQIKKWKKLKEKYASKV